MANGLAIEPAARMQAQDPALSMDLDRTRWERIGMAMLMLLPGALIAYTGFNAGGYFPTAPAVAALVLTQALLMRIMLAKCPLEGLAPVTLIAIAGLGIYTLMSVISWLWSHSAGDALISSDIAWVYLLALLLLGMVRARTENLRLLTWGLVLGSSAVCFTGLISRVLPHLIATGPVVAVERLSYPVSYWNAFGLLAALAIVLAFHLTCALSERRLSRALAAGLLPPLCVALYLTLSRGPIAAGVAGLVVYVLAGRPRGLLTGALSSVPPSIVAVIVAYHAKLLNSSDPSTPAAVSEGRHLAIVTLVCVAVAIALRLLFAYSADPRLRRRFAMPRIRLRTKRLEIAAAVAVAIAILIALGAPHTISHTWDSFINGNATSSSDIRSRLTSVSDDKRTELWKVAVHSFESSPLHGHGAGTYQTLWELHRPSFSFVIDAHSLYLQAIAELGVPGFLFLLIAIVAIVVGLARRAKGTQRSIYGALLGAAIAWVLHAGVDWDWQMPVVTLGFFAAAGAALVPRGSRTIDWSPRMSVRLALAAACIGAMVLPVLIIGSQGRFDAARDALYQGNCTKARPDARASIGWLDFRPEPYEVLGYCDLELGEPKPAIAAMRSAVKADPRSWEPYYGLAIAQASAGIDPRPAAAHARRLNPLEPLTIEESAAFRTPSRRAWVERAPLVGRVGLSSTDLAIAPS